MVGGAQTVALGETVASELLTDTVTQQNDTAMHKKTFFKKFLDYFNDANKNKKRKKFDFSIIGGPHFSSDTKLGLGIVAAGLYYTDKADSLLPVSNVSLYGDVTTVGFYLLGIRGTHIFPHDRYRLDYSLYFYSFPATFWGIGYDMGNNDANESEMKRWQSKIQAAFLFKVANNLYIGPMASYDFVRATEVERPDLLQGMDPITRSYGVGVSLVYDSRDMLTNASRGYYLSLSECFRPSFLGNTYAFSTTELKTSYYHPLWKGATLASQVIGTVNVGTPPWSMMAQLGGSFSMRGYYDGRYRDRNKLEGQIELRQHVWKRNGLAAWVGAGTVFHDFEDIRMRKVLPNYGIGYRWEFKKRVNVRLDYGFGKNGQSSFLFNINEAF